MEEFKFGTVKVTVECRKLKKKRCIMEFKYPGKPLVNIE